jgi:hypothetical protein
MVKPFAGMIRLDIGLDGSYVDRACDVMDCFSAPEARR